MYRFHSLESLYSVTVTYRLPDYTEQKYESKIVVKARRNRENYLFTLEERLGVKLNSREPQKIMDSLMTQLGNCLYPMELELSANGELLSVPNFEEVKEVWIKTANELFRQNRTQAFRNYLEMAKMNLTNEKSFLKALHKDTFIQLFFKDYTTNSMELEFANFPCQHRKTNFYVRKIPPYSDSYMLYPAFREAGVQETEGKLVYTYNENCGEPFEIKANIHLITSRSDMYQKKILIEADENEHKVKENWFF